MNSRPARLRSPPGFLAATVLLSLLLFCYTGRCAAQSAPASASPAQSTLSIYAATDKSVFIPLLQAFRRQLPHVLIDYHELNTLAVYRQVLAQSGPAGAGIDLVISSAVDLQFKLVNDGYALSYDSAAARELPDWAVWRNEAFGFTFEPVVIIYNKQRLPAIDVPHTRAELNQLLARQPVRFNGRIATYDPASSGVGYLFATQDAEQSPGFWELVHNFGVNYVKLHDTSADILDRVAAGDYLIGYNVLGSYAQFRADNDPALGVILPQDYTLVMSRVAFIPRSAPHPELAKLFLEFLLSEPGQRIIAESTGLAAIHPAVTGPMTAARLQSEARDSLRPIRVGPGLLVYLDQFKRAKFLSRWNRVLRNRD